MQATLRLCLVLLAAPLGEAARARQLRTLSVADNVGVAVHISSGVSAGAADGHLEGTGKNTLRATVESMVASFLDGKGPSMKDIVKMAHQKMDIDEAMRQLDGKLPQDVASLVRVASGKSSSGSKTSLDENSLQKARGILNDMIYQGWMKLDDLAFEIAEFHERNRGTYNQVVADLARLGSQLARLGEERVTAGAGIVENDNKFKEAEELLGTKTSGFESTRAENAEEMALRRNDLAVFDFILKLTACPSPGLVQLRTQPHRVRICNASSGPELHFDDPKLQASVERAMTPEARLALRRVLGQAALLQEGDLPESKVPVVNTPVQEEPDSSEQWKKCVDKPPNCGLLHDLMSLEWGKFRDSFDELAQEMKQNQESFDKTKININEQLTAFDEAKTRDMEALASAISQVGLDTTESNEKEEQKRQLSEEMTITMAEFHKKVVEVLFTEICAIRTVRNEILINSTLSPPVNLVDCDFTDWTSETGQCIKPSGEVILCDDTCDTTTVPFDPFKCGGLEVMKRDIIVVANAYGMKCPPLKRQKRCGQKKCPVNCVVSEWSGWSACTKDCEGGVQTKTRDVLTKPKNGGTPCESPNEEQNCNTGSCDRDCKLADWSDWRPCSMACGGGITSHTRKVIIPIRGQGKCPAPDSEGERLMEKECNTQACEGDEICIAHQDLVIALDASGSLREEGFSTLRDFTASLIDRYRSIYYGKDSVRIGLVLFGNGHLIEQPDGSNTIASAIPMQEVTDNLQQVRASVMATTWQKGFTNMAQALQLADNMLSQLGGRRSAQSSVLVISDGKFSFKHQTDEKARELKDKNILLYMAPVTDFESGDLETLKRWASQPWETNYERIPGLAALEHNAEIFVQRLVAKFCPDSFSPKVQQALEAEKQYMLVREDGTPPEGCASGWLAGSDFGNVDDCALHAREHGALAFAYGSGFAQGRCYVYLLPLTEEVWTQWKNNRADVQCSPKANFVENSGYRTYVIDPSTVPATTVTTTEPPAVFPFPATGGVTTAPAVPATAGETPVLSTVSQESEGAPVEPGMAQ